MYYSTHETADNSLLLMHQPQQMSSDFVICLNVLEAVGSNSVDPNQTANICSRCHFFSDSILVGA